MASLRTMATCPECSSTDIEYSGEWPSSCEACGFQWNVVPDNNSPIYTEKDWDKQQYQGQKTKLDYLIKRQIQRENRKSPAHHEGLNYIKEYQDTLVGLSERATSFFNKGVKAQSNKLRQSNEISKMFMPTGKANSSLFASFSCLLYAHRYLTGEWNSHLNFYANYIELNYKPKKNNNTMKKSAIKRDLSYSYSKIRTLVIAPQIIPNQRSRSIELTQEINNILTLFVENNNKMSKESLHIMEEITYRIKSTVYQQKLENTIPNSSLDLVASEILWKVLNLEESKISRNELSRKIFNLERRMSDKKSIVDKIISTIEIDNEI